MKKFWCLFLIAILLLGCVAESDAPIGIVSPAPETPEVAEATADTETETPEPTPEATAVQTEAPTPEPTRSPEERLYAYIEGLSTEEKIGQLCMFGFSGTKEIGADFKKILQEYRIGSVMLYGQNIVRTNSDGGFLQCSRLTDSINGANKSAIPLLIGLDVEGGRVTRFHWKTTLKSAQTLGSKNSDSLAFEQFRYIAEWLTNAGINVNLAPCLDVAKEPGKTFLGNRIISSDEEIVSDIGLACVEGLHDGGCLSIVKHFPGHGATDADSHQITPVVQKSFASLQSYELIPFSHVLGEADGVLVAHISYPKIDDAHIASQSEIFITEILRGELGFSGIVMSDDFRMDGLRKQTSLQKGAVRFILAGGDLILCGANHSYQREILKGLYAAVEDGTISEARLNESVYRILSAKMRVTGWDPFENEE